MAEQYDELYGKAARLLGEVTSQIPKTAYGPERGAWLAEHFDMVPQESRVVFIDLINSHLALMIERDASDIEMGGHATNGKIWMRIQGRKEPAPDIPVLDSDAYSVLILNLMNKKQRQTLIDERNLDFSYSFKYEKTGEYVRFRADAYFDLDFIGLNMRAIAATLRTVDTLGFHPKVLKVMHHQHVQQGLVLVTGITGSGKSTTLDAIVDMHNNTDPAHVVIIAAPIEYVHKSKKCIIRNREVGRDVPSFKDGVIQALRQDPDIIIIGEMRDPQTIMSALEVTDTGHKVFSTLHTSSAVESLDRIIAEVNPHEQERVRHRLADVLTAVVSQKLVPSLDGKRVMAKEVLVVTPNVQAAIKNNNTSEIYMMINQSSNLGMVTMEQDLKRLYMAKSISLDNAIAYANNKTRMRQILGMTQ